MKISLAPNDLERLRRQAKKTAFAEGVTHTQALDREAVQRGFQNWAILHRTVELAPGGRYPIFSRTLEEMRAVFRIDSRTARMSDADRIKRREMPDLWSQYSDPLSALEYARNYLELALSLPRYAVHSMSVGYIEMRVLLPYVLQPLEGRDRFILLGRDYKPLGMAQRDDHVQYEDYRNLHVQVPTDKLHAVTRHPQYSPGYLYGASPYLSRRNAEAYLVQLNALIELVSSHSG